MSTPTPGANTGLACQTCRYRKLSCDGLRPSCSYCLASGIACVYRPTPTNFDGDGLVLGRLDGLEQRVLLLENKLGPSRAPAHQAELEFIGVPDSHTAAAHKMLRGWPRVRLSYHASDSDIQKFLQLPESDDEDLEYGSNHLSRVTFELLLPAVKKFFTHRHVRMPLLLLYTLSISPNFSRDAVLGGLRKMADSASPGEPCDVQNFSAEQLLISSIAVRVGMFDKEIKEAVGISKDLLSQAMHRQMCLLSRPDSESVSVSLALAAYLMGFWNRPFHAVGILNSLTPALNRLAVQYGDSYEMNDNVNATRRFVCFSVIHQVLESDVLTETDGLSSKTRYVADPKVLLLAPPASRLEQQKNVAEGAVFLTYHYQLRCHLNQILHDFYTPNKAYAMPKDLATLVASHAARLDAWLDKLPMDLMFYRGQNPERSSPSLEQRWLYCAFLVHRPVLYFFLHKEMEYTVHQGDIVEDLNNVPWIANSCKQCLMNAYLIIQGRRENDAYEPQKGATYFDWFEAQVLFAVYLVFVQLRPSPVIDNILHDIGDIAPLLDYIEELFEKSPVRSDKNTDMLRVLVEVRANFPDIA